MVCPGVPGPPEQNLAAAALAAFRAATGWAAAPLELRIDKRVPVAAGLGGGSGDAAAALRLAAAASGLGEQALLLELARGLGADVPAQVRPGRWLARGAGELLHALPEPRAPFGVLVLPAAAALSTAAVYAQADRIGAARGADELQELHGALARELADGAALPAADLLANDLQDAARALCPEIDAALAQARGAGADVALLSGSGPTVLGLFAGPDGPARARAAAAGLAGERAAAGLPAALAAEPVGADLPMRHNSRPHEQNGPHRPDRGLRRSLQPGALRRPDPGAGVVVLRARLGARRGEHPLAVRACRARRRRRPRRAGRRLLLGLTRWPELAALDAVTEAVESGAGLPEVVRAAAKALDASLAVTDAWGATLAVAARSPAEERSLLARADGVNILPLRVADAVVGSLHMRARADRAEAGQRP